ncbi:hypothetical protein C7974DRAFT_175190 [Boeremia exigua]|uniref:uncharacterized protein n=1 Tax=Boeremia exigua TaxID=749465 RepID=UPI001E8E939F|nr:uncharacterized protein C7974DRAFT_175190 [Boeremia exigua]KAH6633604.1 hypothetical protein C7974DRAFT_175190 [Boeremia exigua]
MKLSSAKHAILAPALVSAAALAMPEPTQHLAIAVDNWSPAPTAAPQFTILGRAALQANEGNTCGFVSGLSASPVSCPNSNAVCATNTFYGVHGCCDAANLSSCTIATACIPSTAIRSSCTDSSCTSDSAIAKCTAGTATECYQWLFAYDTTTMTQHGCAPSAFTSTAQRTYGPLSSSIPVKTVTVTASASPVTTAPSEPPSSPKKQSLGPIVGGTVGGCTVISLVALAAFIIHRRRRRARASAPPPSMFSHNSPSFDPRGFPAESWNANDVKTGPSAPCLGVAEVHGHDRAVEVEAREKVKGRWYVPGRGAVEVEGQGREKGGWGVVEAPS